MKKIGGLNQFSAAANLTLSQHSLEKKKKLSIHFFNKATNDIFEKTLTKLQMKNK